MRFLILISVVAFALVACGGGASAATKEYLRGLEALNASVRAHQQQVDADYDNALSATEFSPSVRKGFADYLEEQRDVAMEYVAGAEDLHPPPDAEDLHADAVDAYQAFADEVDTVITTVNSAQTLDDLVSALGAPAAIEAAVATTAACQALQRLADDEDVDVDLQCQA